MNLFSGNAVFFLNLGISRKAEGEKKYYKK